MKRLICVLGLSLTLAFVVACGGGKGDVLHLKGQDVPPEMARIYIRALFTKEVVGAAIVCVQVRGLSPDALLAFMETATDPDAETKIIPGATPRPGQEGELASRRRLAVIWQEECMRMFPT